MLLEGVKDFHLGRLGDLFLESKWKIRLFHTMCFPLSIQVEDTRPEDPFLDATLVKKHSIALMILLKINSSVRWGGKLESQISIWYLIFFSPKYNCARCSQLAFLPQGKRRPSHCNMLPQPGLSKNSQIEGKQVSLFNTGLFTDQHSKRYPTFNTSLKEMSTSLTPEILTWVDLDILL